MRIFFALFLVVIFFLIDKTYFIPISAWNEEMVYQKMSNIYHPSWKDYRLLQRYLRKRNEISQLKDYAESYHKFKLIGKFPEEKPQFEIIGNGHENCIILYASFNGNYPAGVKRLVQTLRHSDYQGDILYRIGGWPNTEEGDITLAHVPYAFKVSLFREAKRLGYKRVLWLDASFVPTINLNDLFDQMAVKGYYILQNTHNVGPYFTEKAAQSLGITLEESFQIPSCSAGIIGFDFSHKKSIDILGEWYEAARSKEAYLSPRSEQNVLSVILHKHGCTEWADFPEHLFDRKFVHKW